VGYATAVIWWSPALLVLVGCPREPEAEPCSPGGEPTLEIGLGIGAFEPLPEGGDMPLVHGPQGGWHLEIGLLATHLAADDLVTGSMEGTVDGEVLASVDPWIDLRCDPAAGGLTSWGTRLIYETPTSDELDGVETTVTVEVRDLDGTPVRATRSFVIRDTE
jgi:hypothetical protein